MKNVDYLLERCEEAVDTYFSESSDDTDRALSLNEIDLLTDILEPQEIPLRLVLKMHHALFDAVMNFYEKEVVVC